MEPQRKPVEHRDRSELLDSFETPLAFAQLDGMSAVALAGVHAVAFAMVTWPLPWADIDHVPLPVLARNLVGKKGHTEPPLSPTPGAAARPAAALGSARDVERGGHRCPVVDRRDRVAPDLLDQARVR
jgi:hypothetical protein